jgi:ubiquinone/menaquinone biosynthesis C-methylase UbiE
MADVPPEIIDHYTDEVDEGERIAEGFGQLELLRVQEVVRRHLPPGSLRVLDVGGGTGVHAQWLAADGHTVHVVDPVERHVEQAALLDGVTSEMGDARRLSAADNSADVVLLFGPLYHLVDAEDRVLALREAVRVVRPGGLVFVATVSKFASLFDGLARGFLFERDFPAIVGRDLHEGEHRNPDRLPHRFTTAYFHHPDELRAEISSVGLDVLEMVGVEGLAGWLAQLADRWDDPEARELILYSARAVESEPSLLGLSAHLLAGARLRSAA